MAHEVEVLHVHGIGERQDIAQEVLGAVVADLHRTGARAIAALVGCDGTVAGAPQRPQLVAPGPRRLREPVEEQDLAPFVRPTGPAGEGQAAGLDLEPVDPPNCVHDHGLRRAQAAAVPPPTRTCSGLCRSVSSGTESTNARCAT